MVATAAFTFQILGPITVVDGNGNWIPLAGDLQRALVAVFLIHPNMVVSVDRLIDALWGERPPTHARTALQNLVCRLRKLLGTSTIVTRSPGYVFRVDEGQIDATRFERLLNCARDAEEGERIRLLEDALELWYGDPLADVFYESFAQPTILRLEELRMKAIEDLYATKLSAGTTEVARELIPDLRALVEMYPLWDAFRQQLARALHSVGRSVDGLRLAS